ncbi:MAG TPA: DUF1353 domain-containing protein [Chthoniobacteraceae bacterium]|nr:DUF1353 domain-containing protein [Chthoniobacteraceae bacterium]
MNQPLNIPIKDGYRLECDYIYRWVDEGRIYRIVVPAGFICDGASVPRFLWTLIGATPDGLNRAAALVHDFIYRNSGVLPNGSFWEEAPGGRLIALIDMPWTRVQADKLFARILREAGVPRLRRRLMYRGVRLGGWMSWHKRKKS